MERKLSKIYTSYNIFLILSLCIIPNYCISSENSINFTGSPSNVIDGDSLQFNNHRIRIQGIDAPEYNQQCKDKEKKLYNCGETSKQYLISLIDKKPIFCKIHSKDKFDRDLCTCNIDNKDIASILVEKGHAISYIDSNYQQEETNAKTNKRGIWQGDFIHPRLFRILHFK